MAEIFFIADLHLGHTSVLKFGRDRFSSIKEHDEYIVNTLNKTLGKRDVLWILGDVAFNQQGLKSLERIRGIKHLVFGNHDRYLRTHHLKIFNKINGAVSFKHDYLLTHIPVHQSCIRPRYKFNIHGHIHSDKILGKEYINVGIECIGYTPLNFEEIKSLDRF